MGRIGELCGSVKVAYKEFPRNSMAESKVMPQMGPGKPAQGQARAASAALGVAGRFVDALKGAGKFANDDGFRHGARPNARSLTQCFLACV